MLKQEFMITERSFNVTRKRGSVTNTSQTRLAVHLHIIALRKQFVIDNEFSAFCLDCDRTSLQLGKCCQILHCRVQCVDMTA